MILCYLWIKLFSQIYFGHIATVKTWIFTFFASQADSMRMVTVSFPVTHRMPELWNAVTGTIFRSANWKEVEGRTEVTLSLPAYGSVFVVFPKEDSGAEIVEPTLVTPVVLKINEWTVNFSEIYKSITRPVPF